jgi:hypothetical protein
MKKLLLTLVAASLWAHVAVAQSSAPAPRRLLFIGDSFTHAQGGIYTHVTELAAVASPPLMIIADHSTFGGAFLHRLWDLQEPLKAIRAADHDVVVLQEDIPETNVADFREYARKFVTEVRQNNARPVLFMAWPYQRLGWISMAEIAKAHREAARELSVDVAPVGLAWQQASKERPGMTMYAPDLEHPSIHGMYLASCVVFATIYNQSPVGLTYTPAGVSVEEASFLQRIAWQTVQDYRGRGL